jgi:hypothetical protein
MPLRLKLFRFSGIRQNGLCSQQSDLEIRDSAPKNSLILFAPNIAGPKRGPGVRNDHFNQDSTAGLVIPSIAAPPFGLKGVCLQFPGKVTYCRGNLSLFMSCCRTSGWPQNDLRRENESDGVTGRVYISQGERLSAICCDIGWNMAADGIECQGRASGVSSTMSP